MARPADEIPIIRSVSELADRYDAWFCDVWGVIHNGREPHPAAVAACERFRERSGRVLFITNAPRPAASVIAQLDRLGVSRSAYDAVVTSGDVTRALIARYSGRPVFHLGPERDLPLLDGLDVHLSSADEAEAIVNTGLFDDILEGPEDYREMLAGFAARGLPMICANPDLVVERGTEIAYCAGSLAELYAGLGGEVSYAGKPHAPIYEVCCERLAALGAPAAAGTVGRERILAIGDGLRTDMAGALAFGIDALFIPSGIHVPHGRALAGDVLTELFEGFAMRPVAAIDGLSW